MKLTGNIRIKNGEIKYLDSFKERLAEFKKQNEGKGGEIIVSIFEKDIEYHRHKYYRGFILPEIADAAFDGDQFEAHIAMKRKFMYTAVSRLADIPSKHRGRCIIDQEKIINAEGKEEIKTVGYMPSMGDISDKEAREYILKVEAFCFSDLQIGIPENRKDVLYDRNKGLGFPTEGLGE